MGSINLGINKKLALSIRDELNIHEFVETGTNQGDTAEWASKHFNYVFSSELCSALYNKAATRFKNTKNIELYHGDSPNQIRQINPRLTNPIFWLDAHWSGGQTAGIESECPLLKELNAIFETATYNPIIMIDDARLFLAPPPPPHKADHWPNIYDIIHCCNKYIQPTTIVIDDVILVFPENKKCDILKVTEKISGSKYYYVSIPSNLPKVKNQEKNSDINKNNINLHYLEKNNMWSRNKPLKLHLGCGKNIFDGYINIDYPAEMHNILKVKPDIECDILKLNFDRNEIDEIRLHHVFEHFNRVSALGLLIRWTEWLKGGGRIIIETPDLIGCAQTIASEAPYKIKAAITRHLAGDQSAEWGYHVDHWFADRFYKTLTLFGYENIKIRQDRWDHPPYLSNVTVIAKKKYELNRNDLLIAAKMLLKDSLVSEKENKAYQIWVNQLYNFFRKN